MNAMLDSLSTWMPELLRTSLQGALLVAVILAVQWVFAKRLTPAWRHALWGLLVVRLLLIWAPASPLSVYNLAVREVAVVQVEVSANNPHTETPSSPAGPVQREEGLAPAPKDIRDFSDGRDSSGWGNFLRGVDVRAAASLFWLGVFGGLLLAMAAQSLHFGRKVRAGRIVTDSDTLELLEQCRATLRVSPFLALVETDCVRSPALLGCIRPKLLLPCGFLDTLSREEMRHIFLHELAHVKRGDIWSGWLFNLLLAAHWFNPAIWFARRRFIADREAACDARVLAALDATGQRDYGHTVLNLTQRFNASPWAPGMAGISETNSNLKRRITMIKQFRPPTRLAAWSGAGLCVCIGLATLTNAQEVKPNAGDIVCEPMDLYGYTAPNGGTMIAAQLTNTGPQDVTVDVEFWEGGIDTGTKIGRGGLVVPAGKTATEAIPWAVENGSHAIAVRIDPDNTATESDESNNRVEATIEYTNGRFQHLVLKIPESAVADRRGGRMAGDVPSSPPIEPPKPKPSESNTRRSREAAGIAEKATGILLNDSQLRAVCQNNLKQLGLIFKMFANESKGEVFPHLSRDPGRLMFAWEGDGHALEGDGVLSAEFLTDHSVVGCPGSGPSADLPDDTDFAYLGYVMRDDADVRKFAEAYEGWAASDGGKGPWFADDKPRSPDEGTARLREGVERFLITDINNPAGAALAQSQIPTIVEWPDRHVVAPGKQGGNVLFMDGHVEFMTYPGKWPMTEETIGILCKLARREPIKKLE